MDCASCAKNVIMPDSINIDMRRLRSRRPFPCELARMLLVLPVNPRISLYTVMILYTIRAVTSAFTPNDKKKNAVTAERYQSGRGRLSATILIKKPRVVNAVTMMQQS
jgi:hypothetical protein